MNIKFQCGDPWLVTPRVRLPRRRVLRPSAAAAGSSSPRAAASPQPGCPKPLRSSTLPAAQKRGLAPPPPADPASGTPPEAQTLASSSSELGSAPWRSLRPRTPREADAPHPPRRRDSSAPTAVRSLKFTRPPPSARRPTRGVCGEGTGK